ncbi:MAG: DUF2207 domain-containing protein [Streptosporangiales bacterium]
MALALFCAAAAVLALPGASAMASSGSVIRDKVAMKVMADGSAKVVEQITYDYGSGGTGFTRTFPTRVRWDDRHDRLFRVHDVSARSGGSSVPTKVRAGEGSTSIDVATGTRVSGRRSYTLKYVVDGLVADSAHGQAITWTAVSDWQVPVKKAEVDVVAPKPATYASCVAGATGAAKPCTLAQTGLEGFVGAKFLQNDLPAGGAVNITVGLPAHTVAAKPILIKRHTLATAFSVTPFTVIAFVALIVLVALGLWLVWRLRGRDARAVSAGRRAGGRRPFVEDGDDIVFAPPGGLRPGQVGTVADEQADVVDVVATVLDLAIRNYVFIEELPGVRPDWRLHKRNEPGEELLAYERAVFDELFEHGDAVLVSELSGVLADDMARFRGLMYRDVVAQGWFASRPDQVRSRWTWTGVGVAVLGVVATILLALFTFQALVGIAVVLAGVAIAVAAEYMPSRTARGSQVLGEVGSLRQYLQGADPQDIPDEHQEILCARLIPYAALFGAEERWARALSESVDAGEEGFTWFAGGDGWRREDLDDSVRNFLVAVTGAVSTSRTFRSFAGEASTV